MPNSRNPYPHEIAYDQHVWLPRANSRYVSLIDELSREDLQNYIHNVFPEVILSEHARPHRLFVQEKLLPRLPEPDLQRVKQKCTELGFTPTPLKIIQVGTHYFPEVARVLGTSPDNPPDNIHRMQRGDLYFGDIYNVNMILSSLRLRHLDWEEGGSYLDFGCSSGSLIRMLRAWAPTLQLFGVDPIKEAICWADKYIPGASFEVSSLLPPLGFRDGSFDGITAVSIFSHLGEDEALAWIDELHRCLKPGGWFCFTTHGHVSLSYYNKKEMYPEKRVRALVEGMINSNFVFEEIYIGASPEGIKATGYGNTYLQRQWIFENLSDKWKFISVDFGASQGNQDIYILRKLP